MQTYGKNILDNYRPMAMSEKNIRSRSPSGAATPQRASNPVSRVPTAVINPEAVSRYPNDSE